MRSSPALNAASAYSGQIRDLSTATYLLYCETLRHIEINEADLAISSLRRLMELGRSLDPPDDDSDGLEEFDPKPAKRPRRKKHKARREFLGRED